MEIREKIIPVLGPKGDDDDCEAVAECIKSGWWVNGPKVEKFENEFKKLVKAEYAIGLTSNTAGLDIILKALNIGDGDDVISPTISFVTTVAVPLWNRCSSRLADVDANNLIIDPKDVKQMINEKTKAIIVVNHAGVSAHEQIKEIRTFFKGLIIEDCAHSCYFEGAGLSGDVAIWSFQGVKTMPCGDGGMLTFNKNDIFDAEEINNKIRKMIWFGVESTYSRDKNSGRFADDKEVEQLENKPGYRWSYDIELLGYKCYMIDINASLCLSQLKKLDKNLARRRFIQEKYNTELKDYIDTPVYSETVQYYCARVPEDKRDDLIKYLAEKKVHTSVHFRPLHLFSYYRTDKKFEVADKEWRKLISLPVQLNMTDEDIDYVIYWVKEFFKN